jgi:hypothetical protein
MHDLDLIVTVALGGKNAPPSKPHGIKTQGPCGMQSPSSEASNTGPGNRMPPPNFQPPGSTTTLSSSGVFGIEEPLSIFSIFSIFSISSISSIFSQC